MTVAICAQTNLSGMFSYSKEPSFKRQPPFSPIEQVAARLVAFGEDNEIFVSGSCVRLAKNLYLTARHVVTDYIDRFGNRADEANFTVWAVHVHPSPEYSIWAMDRLWISPHSDLAVFHTTPYNDTAASTKIAPAAGLDLVPPPVGSRIVGFGHHSANGLITVDANGGKHIEVNTHGTATVGEVREIHRERRDSARLTFPCFRVNARFDGGMSGGPVFNNQGRLCGIICSSLPASSDGDEHCSYVATLWPLMGVGLDINPSPYGVLDQPYPFLDLARKGIVDVRNLESVSVQPSDVPRVFSVTIRLNGA